jgi:GNAT superfamily N-acetyltransferase
MASVTRNRVSGAVQRHGVAGLVSVVANRLVSLAFLDEHHVWYVLDLTRRADLPLADGYELRRVEAVSALEQVLIDVRFDVARARLKEGNQLWVVDREGEPAFNCFIFFDQTPVRAASTRSLVLPPGTACLEDSVTSADHRGRGIAGAAWSLIATELRENGVEVLVTKVAVENAPSRKAVEKAGFLPAAVMHLRRRGFVEHVEVEREPAALTPASGAAIDALSRSLAR